MAAPAITAAAALQPTGRGSLVGKEGCCIPASMGRDPARHKRHNRHRGSGSTLQPGGAVLGIWGAVALASIFAPTIVTGSDGTIVPVAGLFAPVAGAVATGYACLAAAWSAVSDRRL
jgi:hypothetical protein